MEEFKKTHKKQSEPEQVEKKKQPEPDTAIPQNEEPEKHQTGHEIASRKPRPAPDDGQSRHRDKSKDRH